ncbi:hypothetical protein F4861DRAFT_52445 [Xylaria intraflava]|nr:hypothetical protein F4861DRAFT_52445 [Xylaria intraflava]
MLALATLLITFVVHYHPFRPTRLPTTGTWQITFLMRQAPLRGLHSDNGQRDKGPGGSETAKATESPPVHTPNLCFCLLPNLTHPYVVCLLVYDGVLFSLAPLTTLLFLAAWSWTVTRLSILRPSLVPVPVPVTKQLSVLRYAPLIVGPTYRLISYPVPILSLFSLVAYCRPPAHHLSTSSSLYCIVRGQTEGPNGDSSVRDTCALPTYPLK